VIGSFFALIVRHRQSASLLLGVLIISSSILFFSPRVQAGSQIPHNSITINSDSSFTAPNGVTAGNGSPSNPYLISGWSITGNTGDWIRITNTTAFFLVTNVTLNGSGGGIVFNNVTNGAVEKAQVYEYASSGIVVEFSKHILVSYDSSWAGGCGPNEGCGGDGIDILSSAYVVVDHNSLSGTQGDNLHIADSNNVTVTDNGIGGSTYYGMRVLNSHNLTMSRNSFSHSGLEISWPGPGPSPYSITPDNLVNGRPLYYYDQCSSGLTLDHAPVGQLIIYNCSDVHLSNLNVTGTDVGITMNHVQRAFIQNVNASADKIAGLHLTGSSSVDIQNSDFSLTPFSFGFLYPLQWGISAQQSNSTTVSGSRFYSDSIAIEMASSVNATITGNTFSSDYTNICLSSSTGIQIFHNNLFPYSGYYCTSDTEPGHFWDNGYPSGGNYWSNYTGVDKCSGPVQNICTRPDGIGDTPYPIPGGVYQDHYPLMKPFVANADPPASTGGGGGGGGQPPRRL
jgi:parallel beta helix pectate lyase-like protein